MFLKVVSKRSTVDFDFSETVDEIVWKRSEEKWDLRLHKKS